MANLESVFGSLFTLANLKERSSNEEITRVCNEATNAYKEVEKRISMEKRKHVAVISELIKNVCDKQWRTVEKKMDNTIAIYKNGIQKDEVEHLAAPHVYGKKRGKKKNKKQQSFNLNLNQNVRMENEMKADHVLYKEETNTQLKRNQLESHDMNPMEWKRSEVAEFFKDLYKTYWNAAFEELASHGKSDKKGIYQKLNVIMMKRYNRAKSIVDNTLLKMGESVEKTVYGEKLSEDRRQSNTDRESSSISLMKLFLRKNFEYMQIGIKQELESDKASEDLEGYPKSLEYQKRCAIVTCLMMIQDPAMSITHITEGEAVPKSTYKSHDGSKGTKCDYLAFPALLSHSRGEVLVQGYIAFKRD